MTLQEKLKALEEMMELEAGTLNPEMSLDDIEEWDSLAALSFAILMKDEFDKTISGQQIRELETIQDMLDLMSK